MFFLYKYVFCIYQYFNYEIPAFEKWPIIRAKPGAHRLTEKYIFFGGGGGRNWKKRKFNLTGKLKVIGTVLLFAISTPILAFWFTHLV